MQPIVNKLHEKGLVFRQFPVSILKYFGFLISLNWCIVFFAHVLSPSCREAAKGTKWELFADTVLRDPLPNRFLFGEADPKLCTTALKIVARARFLALMGTCVVTFHQYGKMFSFDCIP